MKISIVTPSFNQGRFLDGCLRSIDAERLTANVEHIILDNCSTDETAELLESYKSQHAGNRDVAVIVERDKGQTDAINRGFSMAAGNIICWLNTDERYKPGALAKVSRYFEEHPEVDVVFGDVEFVTADQQSLRVRREPQFSEAMLLYYGCFVTSCATFIRRTAAVKAGPLDDSLKVVMDFEWYLRLSRSGAKFSYIPELLASFTWHETNISSTFFEKRKAERLAVQIRYSRLPVPQKLRLPVYSALRYWWIIVRVARRQLARVAGY